MCVGNVLRSDGRCRPMIACSDSMLESVQRRLLLKFRAYVCLPGVCKLYRPFSVEPNLTTLAKEVIVQCEDTNKFSVFACDIPLCYDSIILRFCVSQTQLYLYSRFHVSKRATCFDLG